MSRNAALSIGMLAVAGLPALALASPARHETVIVVKPAVGSSATRFTVSFSAPKRTGRTALGQRRYQVTADGPFANGCVSSAFAQAPPTRIGARVNVTLDPGERGTWCAGDYQGRVDLVQTDLCTDDALCPHYVIMLGKVGTFEFRVLRDDSDGSAAGFPHPSD